MEGRAEKRPICEYDGTPRGASSSHTSTEGDGMVVSSGCEYEVFLSFRGPDTRAGFTDFLYTSLKDAGIRTFKDDEDLRKGEEFAPELLRAIKQSKILIPIFSKDYASSVWCLKEVAQMVECKKTGEQKIMPIFYDVAPTEVRYQTGHYKNAFLLHESKQRYDQNAIREWKDALTAVTEINGWDLQNMPNRREGEFVKTFKQKVFNELKKASLVVSDYVIGVEDHVDKIMEMIGAWTSETRIIGIHGMGGIGKTTIAKVVYNQLSKKFSNCCFLSNIRETSETKGIVYLQNQLISEVLRMEDTNLRNSYDGTQTIRDRLSDKKVLILLDDVDHKKHTDALVGHHDWFGKGSKLIITTRNKDILKIPEVDDLYEVNIMDPDQSLQLFSKHAFRRDYPLDEYINQSKRAIEIAGGLPLTLEVIGSLLSRTDMKKWDDKLEKLGDILPADVQSKLKISYDALEDHEQHVFLDIACLFIEYDKDIMVYFWESKYHPKDAMDVLENMSLIKIIEDNKVQMHDQLKDLGRQIVRQKSNMEIKRQSRVWDPQEAWDLLRRHEGMKEVEALRLKFDHQHHFIADNFKSLSNLTFLGVDGSKENFHAEKTLLWNTWPSSLLPTNFLRKNSNLLPRLRWLSWHDIPPSFKITHFFMEDVVVLDLSQSEITHDWKGWSHMKVMKNLKVLDLTDCRCLKKTPIFSTHSNVERLILQGCSDLVEIDMSICQLKCLVSLDVRNCLRLERLPDELGRDLANLEYLYLSGCEWLERLPYTIGNLKSLVELDISKTRFKELPDSIREFRNLRAVKMGDSDISKVPDAIWTIEKLERIEADKGYRTERFQVNIGDCIYRNQSLRILRLKCADIHALPKLPESLIELKLGELCLDTFPDLSNLTNLKVLDLSFGRADPDGESNGLVEDWIPTWIGNLRKLESLALGSHYVTTVPTNFSLPPQLKSLCLRCPNLRLLPRLPSSLSSLSLNECESLYSMDLSNLKRLSSLEISCAAIAEIQDLSCLENLRDLRLHRLEKLWILSDLTILNKLKSVHVTISDRVEIQCELSQFLDIMDASFGPSLQKLSNLSSLSGKQKVNVIGCWKLDVKKILGFFWPNLQGSST